MKIALDGVDCTGKTTISEALANKYGCNIVRLTNGGDRSLMAYLQFTMANNVIHDRTFLSEIVYPKFFNRESRLNVDDIPILFKMLDAFNVQTFILTASPETLRSRFAERGDEFITDMNVIDQINQEYLRIASLNPQFTVIDTTDKTIDEIVEEIGVNLKW